MKTTFHPDPTKALRASLKAAWREFRRCSYLYPYLFHEMWTPTCRLDGHDVLAVCKSFRDAYADSFHDEWEEWHGPHDVAYLGRFTGDGDGLCEFQQIADSTYLILREIQPNLRHDGWHGWIYILYEMAYGYPTPFLRCSFDRWNDASVHDWRGDEPDECSRLESGGAPYPLYPLHQALEHNVFTSSMAALDLILDKDGAALIGEWIWDIPVSLSGGDDSERLPVEGQSSVPPTAGGPVRAFHFDGVWNLEFDTGGTQPEQGRFPEMKGMGIYKLLLEHPFVAQSPSSLLREDGQVIAVVESGDVGDDRLDELGLSQVREELLRIQRQLDDTVDPERQQELAETQKELLRYQKASVNRFGRHRKLGSLQQRLEKRVHGQLRRARQMISTQMPHFAVYLEQTVGALSGDFVYHPRHAKKPSTALD